MTHVSFAEILLAEISIGIPLRWVMAEAVVTVLEAESTRQLEVFAADISEWF